MSADDKVFLFIESNTSGTGAAFIQAARDQGYVPVLFSKEPSRYGAMVDDLAVVQVDTDSASSILNEARSMGIDRVVGVYSSSDYFVEMAARTAESLGLPSPGLNAVSRCRRKSMQRASLSEAGLPSPGFEHIEDANAIAASYARLGPVVVIKPESGSGSFGVELCASLDAALDHASRLLGSGVNERGAPFSGVLVEEFVDGPEYSVEIFDGAAIAVTGKHLGPLPHFVEIGHDLPALVTPEVEAELIGSAIRGVSALGLTWGPIHVELRLSPAKGAVIIEVNPRLAGGHIPRLIELSTGLDLIGATVARASGQVASLERRRAACSSIRFLTCPGTATLVEVVDWGEVAEVPGVVEAFIRLKAGDSVVATHDFRDRIGHVIVEGVDGEETARAATRAVQRADIRWMTP